MSNTKNLQVLYCRSQLECDFSCAVFGQLKVSCFHVIIQVFAMDLFQNNEGIANTVKQIYKSIYVRVLAHFQNISFSLLLIYLYRFHVSLPYYFDSNTVAGLQVSGTAYFAKFTLTQWMLKSVEVLDIFLFRTYFDKVAPFLLLL